MLALYLYQGIVASIMISLLTMHLNTTMNRGQEHIAKRMVSWYSATSWYTIELEMGYIITNECNHKG
jgi:hypothetical protein